VKYNIKRGKHFANFTLNRLFPFTGKSLKGNVRFSYNCLSPEVIPGWNKLTGISSLKIHNNSGRLVWRAQKGKIMIAGYVYKDGRRNEMLITSLLPDIFYPYSVEYKKGVWVFSINGTTVMMPGALGFWKFKCFPYFGGKSTAPEDLVIHI